jgi:hypothetical protein
MQHFNFVSVNLKQRLMKMLILFAALVGFSSFSAFLASDEFMKPPVELNYFKLSIESEKVELTWETASEQFASHVEIERSSDKINFEKIGSVKLDAAKNKQKSYKFTDPNPFADYSYYRLKMIDIDGQFDYSEIITAYIETVREITEKPKKQENSGLKP